jgi:hypothetical protein
MDEIRAVAKDLHILNEFKKSKPIMVGDDEFMMELVRLLRPLWKVSDKQLEKIQEILSLAGRIGVGSIPVVGDAIDLYELLTGRDFFTDEPLTFGERVASGLGVVAGAGAQWRAVAKGLGGLGFPARSIHNADEARKAIRVAQEASENGSRVFQGSKSGTRIEQIGYLQVKYRGIKSEENHRVLTRLADELQTKNIPRDWPAIATKVKDGHQGLEFRHPDFRDVNIRVMPGNPRSPYPNSQQPYVRQSVHGQSIDKNGRIISNPRSNEAHIPLKEFMFTNFWSNYVKK